MIKLLVFSDTHGTADRMLRAAANEKNTDAFFFLGDGSKDADILAEIHPETPLYRVAGNCDFASLDPTEGFISFGGLLFFYTHGHRFGVKTGLNQLLITASVHGANVALYGHTHMAHLSKQDNVFLFNPGSLTLPRAGGACYGRITINDEKPVFEIVYI